MPNKRIKQIQKSTAKDSVEDRLTRLSAAVYECLTTEDKIATCPSRQVMAMQMVIDGRIPAHMSAEEKDFFWICLNMVVGGEEFTADGFHDAAMTIFSKNRKLKP